MVDTYQADLDQAETNYEELHNDYTERINLKCQGKPTGRIDYRIKSKHKELQTKLVQIEKMLFLHEKGDKKLKVNKLQKKKRIKKLKDFIGKTKSLQAEVEI